jgi:hypothetical protein
MMTDRTVRSALLSSCSQVLAFFSRCRASGGTGGCAAAHYWARELGALGHEVRLMPAQYVKSYVERNKNDAARGNPAPFPDDIVLPLRCLGWNA